MPDKSQQLTREQLYELVWKTPMVRLAGQFGISDNGLAKICRRLEVPYPPRGWWAKLAAGKPVTAGRLPPAGPGTPSQVCIAPAPDDGSSLKTAIRDRQQSLEEIRVPGRLTRPHPLIVRWRDERQQQLERARQERVPWRRSPNGATDFSELDRRRDRLLQALFGALEKHGAIIAQADRGELIATIMGEKIEFSLEEKSRQVTRPMTAREREWESWNKSGVKTELQPTGFFQFSIRAWIDQPCRRNWRESERRPLDAMLPEIVATFLELAPLLVARTRKQEEQARIYADRQRQWEVEREQRQQDVNRWKRFLELARASEESAVARTFIARLRQTDASAGDPIDGRTLLEWMDWAEHRANSLDPLSKGADSIFANIAEVKSWTYPPYAR